MSTGQPHDQPGETDRDGSGDGADGDGSLVIGRNVRFQGTIADAGLLDVYGVVRASIPNGRLAVAETGNVVADANVESATIAGCFEGTLHVHGRLTVAGTGRVHGTIRYGELAVAPGGRLTGDVDIAASGETDIRSADVAAPPAQTEPPARTEEHAAMAEPSADEARSPEPV